MESLDIDIPQIRKDGTEGVEVILPPLSALQRDPKYVRNFVRYSTYDAEATWLLRNELEKKLRAMTWNKGTSMWDFYSQLYPPSRSKRQFLLFLLYTCLSVKS